MKNKASPSPGSQEESLKTKIESVDKPQMSSTKFGSLFFWVLILGALLVAGYFALRMYGEIPEIQQEEVIASSVDKEPKKELSDKEKLKILEEQVKNLTEKVEKYALSEKEFVATIGEISALNARLNILETRLVNASIIEGSAIDGVEAAFNEKEQEGNIKLKKIAARLSAIENSLHIREQLGKNGFGVLTSFAALQSAVLSGQIYIDQLKAFREQYPFKDEVFQEAIKDLAPYSEEGLVTPTQLYLSFPNLADEMSKVNRVAPKSTWQEIENKILDLVSIRPIAISDAPKESLSSHLVEMEAFLSRGDVSQAVKIFDTLDPSVQEVGLSWADSAKAYVQVEQAIRKLEALVFWRALGRVPVSEKKPSEEKENSSEKTKDNA